MASSFDGPKPFPKTTGDMKRVVELLVHPIHKVGLVLVRDVHGSDPEVCLTQVKAKNPEQQDEVDFGLPKGTRQYRDPTTGAMMDARDVQTALQHRDALEPLSQTLMNECEQEIGLGRAAMAKTSLRELGPRLFISRSGAAHDIQWYVIEANTPLVASMDPNPEDAHQVKWCSLSEIRAMQTAGKINASYVKVATEAVAKLKARELRPSPFLEPQPTI